MFAYRRGEIWRHRICPKRPKARGKGGKRLLQPRKDAEATALRSFADPRSYVMLDGREKLEGLDMDWQRKMVYERDQGNCQLVNISGMCHGWVKWVDAEIDHIVPRSKGRDDRESNLRTVCKPCHRARHIHVKWSKK